MANLVYKIADTYTGKSAIQLNGDDTLLLEDMGAVYYNASASNITLPSIGPIAQGEFEFHVAHASELKITAAGGETILYKDRETAAAGYISSSTLGDRVVVRPLTTTQWSVTAIEGTWSVDGSSTINPTDIIELKDATATAGDVNASMEANATDTGDGTEDIDVTFQQQVAGTPTTFLNSDADGVLTLGLTSGQAVLPGVTDGGALGSGTVMWSDLFLANEGVINWNNGNTTLTHSTSKLTLNTALSVGTTLDVAGAVTGLIPVETFSGDDTLTQAESGKTCTNDAVVALTLPTAVAGMVFTFVVGSANYLRVNLSAGDTAQYKATASAAGGYFRSATQGDVVRLECLNATEWYVTSLEGTWTFDS
jgi:hypothetical protein